MWKAAFERNSYSGVACMSKVFLAIIITAIGTLIGVLFVFAAFTLQAASFG